MFNEVFLFFYAIKLINSISFMAGAVAISAITGYVITAFACALEDDFSYIKKLLEDTRAYFITAIALLILLPSEEAMYAGAGYYVAEQTEVTDTLLMLKEAVDQKLEEAVSNDTTTETRN